MSKNKVKEAGAATKRKTHKYSEIDGEEIEEEDVNRVLGKTTQKSRERHAFDGVTDDTELTEQQVNMLKREARKRRMVRYMTWVSDKFQALCWMGVSALIIYKTNFFR